MVIELSGVQFGLKTHAQSQNQTNAEHKFDLRSQLKYKYRPFYSCVYLVAKPLIWSEAEGDLVVIETSIQLAW